MKSIFVTFQKEGVHCYPGAPDPVGFLRNPHRHMFHFCVEMEVFHNDREVEFILLKRELESLYGNGTLELNFQSCEMMCDSLYEYLKDKYGTKRLYKIEVSEDGENGCRATYGK